MSAAKPASFRSQYQALVTSGEIEADTAQARAVGPREVWSGSNFTLSAMRSSAADGRRIVRNIWMWE